MFFSASFLNLSCRSFSVESVHPKVIGKTNNNKNKKFTAATSYLQRGHCDIFCHNMKSRERSHSSYILIVFLAFLVGCEPVEPSKTAVFAVVAPDISTDFEAIKTWSTQAKTKGEVHVFADPIGAKSFSPLVGNEHFVEQDVLAQEMSKVLSKMKVDRLIIFIETHGASNGNFCYKNKTTCQLTEDFLVTTLQSQLSNKRLKQVLIIPTSCYNKPTMERFHQKAKTTIWPFSVAYLEQDADDFCTTISLPSELYSEIFDNRHLRNVDQTRQFLQIDNLEDLVNLNNRIYTKAADNKSHLFSLRYLNNVQPILFDDFGFNIKVVQRILTRTMTNLFRFHLEKLLVKLLRPSHWSKNFINTLRVLAL